MFLSFKEKGADVTNEVEGTCKSRRFEARYENNELHLAQPQAKRVFGVLG